MTLRLFLSACLFFGAIGVAVAAVPKLAAIPAWLPPAVRAPLAQRWTALDAKRGSLKSQVDAHNGHCAAVDETSPQAADCQAEQRALEGQRESYAQEVVALNNDIARAIANHPPGPPPKPAAPSLPVIDPIQLVPADLDAYNRAQLSLLSKRKAMLERILKRLNTLREQQDSYAQELGKMQNEVFLDALTDALSGLSNAAVLQSVLKLPPQRAAELAKVLGAFKSGVTAVAAVEALSGNQDRDVERGLKKVRDLSQTALEAIAGMTELPRDQAEALKQMVRLSYASVKAVQESDKVAGASARTQIVTCLDGLLAQSAAYYAPLRVARGAVNASFGAYAYFQIEADKEAIRDALVNSQQGKQTIIARLAQTDERIEFYTTEIKKTGRAGVPPAAGGKK